MRADEPQLELARLSLPRAIVATAIRAQVDVQAAQVAFNAVFALGPLLALTMTLIGALPIHQLGQRFRDVLVPSAPAAVRPFLDAQLRGLNHAPNAALIVLSVLGILWSISSSTSAITTALGQVGWQLFPGWFRQRARAALLGVLAAVGLVLSALAATIGPVVLRLVSRVIHVPLEGLISFAWVRWPVAGVVFALASAMFVSFGTAQRPRPLAVIWGGLTSGLVSLIASWGLGLYFSHAPRLGGAYGAAGAVFAALLWLYVLALGLLLGSIVAFVLNARGASLGPMIVGASHVGTYSAAAMPRLARSTKVSRKRHPQLSRLAGPRIHQRGPHALRPTVGTTQYDRPTLTPRRPRQDD